MDCSTKKEFFGLLKQYNNIRDKAHTITEEQMKADFEAAEKANKKFLKEFRNSEKY